MPAMPSANDAATAQASTGATSAGATAASPSPGGETSAIQVSGRQMELGDALRTRIADELVAGIGKYFVRGGSAEVVVGRDGPDVFADVVVHLASGQQLVARGVGGDAHAAFDAALTRTQTRIRRYKRRLVNHHPHNGGARRPAETAPLTVLRAPDEGDDDYDDDGTADSAGGAPAAMVIAETQAAIKTQTVSMAVMELDLADAPAIVFRNAAHGGLSVVYRRRDGHIGWIDPERTRAAAAAGSPNSPQTRM